MDPIGGRPILFILKFGKRSRLYNNLSFLLTAGILYHSKFRPAAAVMGPDIYVLI